VFINGKKLEESYRAAPPNPVDNYGPVTVPSNEYFMMGDNRDDSYDSRYWGFVPRANIIGTPVLVYMSIDAPGDAWDRDTFATDVYIRERFYSSEHRALASHLQNVLIQWEHAARSSRHGRKSSIFMDYAESGVEHSLADQAKQRIRRLASRTFTRV